MSGSQPSIPDLELLRPIGHGAFGQVWLARALTGQLRAVKIVDRAALPNQRAFDREFEGLLRFEPVSRTQPNLVHVLHVGRASDGQAFWYVMELADPVALPSPKLNRSSALPTSIDWTDVCVQTYEPRTLRAVLRQDGHLRLERCRPIALGLSEAVAHLHAHGLVHRDIKPSNVIFVDGVPKLADIGLVTGAAEQPSFVGTAGYIPPDGPGTRAADIYALGKVFYEMATGRPVQDFPRLSEDFSTLADQKGVIDFNEIILRAADNDPRRRYASMEDLRSDLLLLEAGRSVRRWRGLERRLKVASRVGIGIAAIASVSLALSFWANWERLRALQAERELTARFVQQQLALARATRMTGLSGQRDRTLEIVREAARQTNSLALRNEAIAALALPDVKPFRVISTAGSDLTFDPRMQRYATNDPAGDLHVHWLEDSHPVAYLSRECPSESYPATGLLRFEFSADGDYLCGAYTNQQLLIWSLSGPERDNPGRDPPRPVGQELTAVPPRVVRLPYEPADLKCIPGQPLVAVESAAGFLHFFDIRDGRQVRVLKIPPHLGEIVFSADGTRFARIRENVLTIQDADSGEVRSTLTNDIPLGGLAWHPDGLQIVTWAWPGERALRLWNLETGRSSATLRGHDAEAIGAAFDASGQWMASSSWDNQTVVWSTAQQREIIRLPGSGNLLHLSADARRIAWRRWNHQEWEIFEMTPPSEVARLEQHPGLETPEGLRSLWGLTFLDEEILAGVGDEGFTVWQPPAGYALLLAKVGLERPLFACPGRGLFSSGAQGLRHWPITMNTAGNEVQIGPPERLSPPQLSGTGYFALSTNGLRTALVTMNRQLFLHTEHDEAAWRELAGRDVYGVTIAPGGRYVAACFKTGGVRIWDAEVGSVLTNLPCASGFGCDFSPDGCWLAVQTAASFQLWHAPDWRLTHEIHRSAVSGPVQAWSPDGQMLLVHDADSTVRLLRTGTWEELGSLPAPKLVRQPCFSPDSSRLALPSEKSGVELWDLRRLRQRLNELSLDWGGPLWPPRQMERKQHWSVRVVTGS